MYKNLDMLDKCKAIMLVFIAVLIALTSGPREAYAMYGDNIQAKFCTQRGSFYEIYPDAVARYKFDGTIHFGAKNIYYVPNNEVAEKVKRTLDEEKTIPGWDVRKEPVVGYSPIDVYLNQYGKKIENDGFHHGHDITEIGDNTNQVYCRKNYGRI